jgi:uncharacterized protein (TIGR03437 family)
MRLAPLALLLAAATCWPAAAQSWDTSGNNLLNGTYYFREVFYVIGDSYGDLNQAITLYGTVSFNGSGAYTMSATDYDSYYGAGSGTLSGTYGISASGYGFISNPLSSSDYIYGLVSKNGVFVGSSTESTFNDLFVAAPVSSSTSVSTFKGTYWLAGIDLSSGDPRTTIGTFFQVNPDGAGNLGNVTVSGYVAGYGSQQMTQTLSSVKYNLSNSAFNVAIPTVTSSTALISGQKFLYISPDGSFVFGGSPAAWDFFVGVRVESGTPNFSGLYYQAGIDEPLDSSGTGYLDSYYGSLNDSAGAIVGTQRLSQVFASAVIDYTYSDTFTPSSSGTYSDSYMRYAANATARVGCGIGPSMGLHVAVAAPTLSGSGVFLNPQGVVNAASWAPFTAAIAPGEFLTLVGTGLAPDGLPAASSVPFPTDIGGVQVKINGTYAPLYYATPEQIVAIVPYGTSGSIAQIQVINNGTASNTVTTFIGETAPGVFTQNQNGIGYGAIQHSDYSLVTPSNPARPNDTLFVYLSGLGAVTPSLSDGAAAPSGSLTDTTNTITAAINGEAATVQFAGLVPGAVGLYQINVVVPGDAASGDNLLAIAGSDSYSAEAVIPVGGSAALAARGRAPLGASFPKSAAASRRRSMR